MLVSVSKSETKSLGRGAGFAYYTRDNFALLHYRKGPDGASIAPLEAWGARLVADKSPPVRILVLLERDAIDVDLSQRARMAQVWRDFGPHIASMAFVLLGTGFAAATARAVITAMQALAKPSFALRVFADCDEALRWQCDRPADIAALGLWIDALRAQSSSTTPRTPSP
jgi:hypothetical protein